MSVFIPSEQRLLHCMSKASYLDEALEKGLMFTAHKVTYSPGDPNALFETMIPFIDKLLTKYGKSFATLAVFEQFKLRLICGTISGSLPMICFSEVSKGSRVDHHGLSFGQWGVVVSRDWLEEQGGDRVLYIGESSPLSHHLYQVTTVSLIGGLTVNKSGEINIEEDPVRFWLDFFGYIEIRKNMQESEWRMVGAKNELNTRRFLPFDAIECIFAPNNDLQRVRNFVDQLAAQRKCPAPIVLAYPSAEPIQ